MKIRTSSKYHYFWCPGCNGIHVVDERWEYNGDPDDKIAKIIIALANVSAQNWF